MRTTTSVEEVETTEMNKDVDDFKEFDSEVKGKSLQNPQDHVSTTNKNEDKSNDTMSCNICGKNFKCRSTLMNHTRNIHVNPKKTCSECGKQFQGHHFNKHMRTVHSKQTFMITKLCLLNTEHILTSFLVFMPTLFH